MKEKIATTNAEFARMIMDAIAKLPAKEDYQVLYKKVDRLERDHGVRIELLEERNVLR